MSWRCPVLFTALIAVAGCGPKLDYVSILGGGRVEKLQVRLEGVEKGLCPGQAYQVALRATTVRGETLTTWQKPEGEEAPIRTGHLDFSEFEFRLSGGTVDESGMFRTDPDALVAAGQPYAIAAAVRDDTGVNGRVEYPLLLDCQPGVTLVGTAGTPGVPGTPGTEANPTGTAGGVGGFGGNGGEVQVSSTLVRTLFHPAAVLVKVEPRGGAARHFLVDPQSSQGFTIDCRGGDGGPGGEGGAGATGGCGGPGGGGGDGGAGGVIRGWFDAGQPMLQSFVKYRFEGGAGGDGGAGGAPGDRDAEGRPMLPGDTGSSGQTGADGPLPDIRPEAGTGLFPALPEGVFVLDQPWIPPPPTAG
jgi:hypothetical protein